jgi:hypothetical protein
MASIRKKGAALKCVSKPAAGKARTCRLINDEENAIDAQPRPVEDGCQACTKFKRRTAKLQQHSFLRELNLEFHV